LGIGGGDVLIEGISITEMASMHGGKESAFFRENDHHRMSNLLLVLCRRSKNGE